MSVVKINNTQFYYELHGKGEPLVLIAGLKADHTGWLPVLDKLAAQYTILIFDNRGTGRTVDNGEPFSVETMADDVMHLIQHANLGRPHVVGHSLGGAVAQTMAKKYAGDINSIALCNTFIKFNEVGRKAFSQVLKLYQANESEVKIMESILPWVFSSSFLTPEIVEFIKKVTRENPWPQSARGYEQQLEALFEFDSSGWIHTLTQPTLVIGSDDDKVATLSESQDIAKCINAAKWVRLSTGHGSQVEKPVEFIEALTNFYRTITLPPCSRF